LEAKPLRLFQLCAPDAVVLQLPGPIFWIDTFSPELGNETFASGSVNRPAYPEAQSLVSGCRD